MYHFLGNTHTKKVGALETITAVQSEFSLKLVTVVCVNSSLGITVADGSLCDYIVCNYFIPLL